ncbi:hypothetical protein L6452_32596 [Arctium lappa]|uniref:Uncharacterized protein n=1 Tax=Arctium lappa TaxID=4217 RepID=A0ACB8Z592_ARCLA|nr:hypothetical protein L6452_32596 [Arctium lappa]
MRTTKEEPEKSSSPSFSTCWIRLASVTSSTSSTSRLSVTCNLSVREARDSTASLEIDTVKYIIFVTKITNALTPPIYNSSSLCK